MRDRLFAACEVAGMASTTVGAGLLHLPFGFIVGGAWLVAVGYLGGRA